MRGPAWLCLALLLGAPQGCAGGGGPADAGDPRDGGAVSCQVCAAADICCAAHTANPDGNCQLFDTCASFAGTERLSVIDGCQDYLRVASTPPAPAVCGPHPDAE